VPDLCAARRRARQPARPDLPDQEHARTGRAGWCGDGHAHRPLPVLPRLHDDLPVGGALHAPGRSRPPAYRGALPPPLAGAVVAALARPGVEPAAAVALGIAWRAAGEAACHAVAAAIAAPH